MNVMISGLTAAGKTTHSRLLQRAFGLGYLSVSEFLVSESGVEIVTEPGDSAFWISREAEEMNLKRGRSHAIDLTVDRRLIGAAQSKVSTVFDTFGLPFLTDSFALKIWLESSLESRVLKAIVSHRRHPGLSRDAIHKLVVEKDSWISRYFEVEYGVELRADEARFDLILDLSRFIRVPHILSSRRSIQLADRIISLAVAVYLDDNGITRDSFRECCRQFDSRILRVRKGSVLT